MINLVVPTWTDDLEMVKRMCGWFAGTLGPDTPLHFSRFSPLYKLTHLPPTPVETLERAWRAATAEGLRFVYLGNVPGHPAENTTCPGCGETVIRRMGFRILDNLLKDGHCPKCRRAIPGVWA